MGKHTQLTSQKMAKGAGSGDGKGGVKEYACGSKGCHIGVLVLGIVLLVIGIILLAVSIGSINNNKAKNDAGCTFLSYGGTTYDSCDCYSSDTEKAYEEQCCSDPVDCDDFLAQYFAGWTMLVVGLLSCSSEFAVCACAAASARKARERPQLPWPELPRWPSASERLSSAHPA